MLDPTMLALLMQKQNKKEEKVINIPKMDKDSSVYSQINKFVKIAEGTSKKQAKEKGYSSEYDVTFGYGKYLSDKEKPVSKMTFRELEEFQKKLIGKTKGLFKDKKGNPVGTSAAGAYQFTKSTLFGKNGLLKKAGLSMDDTFSQENQNKLFKLRVDQNKILEKLKRGKPKAARKELSKIWAGVGDYHKQARSPSAKAQDSQVKKFFYDTAEQYILDKKPESSAGLGILEKVGNTIFPTASAIDQVPNQGQVMEKRPNEEVISKDATVRKKISQQAESVMPGSGKEIEDKQSWENLKNDEKAGKVLSPMQNFMKGMSHFTPELIAGSLGGWATGPQAAAKMMEPLRSSGEDSIEERRLQLSKGNLALRIEDLKEQRKRTSNLEEDRALRREKAATERTLQLQNYFGKRKDVQDLVKQRDLLNDIDNIIQGAPELAAGVIEFKIAKGIAGEVGNLTNEERKAAQISPSFYRKLKRGGTKFLQGELPEEDVKELRKVTKALRVRTGSNFKDKISNFVKGRQLYAEPKAFEEALMAEHGFSGESEQDRKESLVNKYYKK
jgi:hypothetical protein